MRIVFAVMVLGALAGCTERVNVCSSDSDCTNPAYPFCDVAGEYSESGHVAMSCSITPASCPIERCGCTPGKVTCSGEELTTCNADGKGVTTETCALGCSSNGLKCQDPLFVVKVSPSSFTAHVNDTRITKVTVTNMASETSGVPMLQVTGLTLGTMSFTSNTCTSGLAPGMSCTAVGNLTATTAGQGTFQVVADAAPGGMATAAIALAIMPPCAATCGPSGTIGCCSSSVVPGNAAGATLAGTPFYRSYDVATDNAYPSTSYPATVSDFRLDTYEVTVGRFRAFVDAGLGTQSAPPSAGTGGRTLNGIASQGGWDPSWNGRLSADTATLKAALKCSATYQSWTDTAGANESLPMNCITWYEAIAFCAWDGGFLPTEAEWNYAAAGGSEQRAYPWSSPAGARTLDCTYANHKIDVPTGTYCMNGTTGSVNRVGSESPKGDGKWGQADIAGNVFEFTLDSYVLPYATLTCSDCADLTTGTSQRVIRGGSWGNDGVALRGAHRNAVPHTVRTQATGVRCARTP